MPKSTPKTEHARRVAAGRCVRCTRDNDGESVFCRHHRLLNRRTVAAYRAVAKKAARGAGPRRKARK